MIILELIPISQDEIALVEESSIKIFNTKLQKLEKKIRFQDIKKETMKNNPQIIFLKKKNHYIFLLQMD